MHRLSCLLILLVIYPHEAHQAESNQTDASSQEGPISLLLHASNAGGTHASKSGWACSIALSRSLAGLQAQGSPLGPSVRSLRGAECCSNLVVGCLEHSKHASHCWLMVPMLYHAQYSWSMDDSIIALAGVQSHMCSCPSFLSQNVKVESHFRP